MESVEELKNKISQLEAQLAKAQGNAPIRQKIQNMSSEVVDSNPYR